MTGVSVVIPNRDGGGVLERCLDALAAATGVGEVIVVDDGSSDGSDTRAAERATVLRSPGRGFAAAVNHGIAHASGEHVLLLNSDVFVAETAVELLAAALDAAPQRALCGVALVGEDGRPQKSCGDLLTLRRALLQAVGVSTSTLSLPGELTDVPYVPFACVLARRTAVREAGGLDDGYRFYFEDYDLCRTLARAGLRIAVHPGAVAVHVGGASSSQGDEAGWLPQFQRSRLRYLRKGNPRGWVLFAGLWAVNATAHSALWLVRAAAGRDRRRALGWARAYGRTILP